MTTTPTLRTLALTGRIGRRWYVRQRAAIQRICRFHGWNSRRFMQVLAITSPRCTTTRNLRVTMHYFRTHTLPPDVIRSTRAALKHWEQTGHIRGPKTSRFYKALTGDPSACPIDTWLCEALNIDPHTARRPKIQAATERRFRRIATELGWTLASVQAAVWVGRVIQSGFTIPSYRITEFVPF